MEEEIVKQEDGSVAKVKNVVEVIEVFSSDQIVDVEDEINNTKEAIENIDQYKEMKLESLTARLEELKRYKKLLQEE